MLVGAEQNHLRMKVRLGAREFTAMQFFTKDIPEGDSVTLAYKLSINEFQGRRSVNLIVADRS